MISDADTIGVFQIESRAQMSMLPRLKPKKFYDLVIEVAIVRPGPIQGDMVHPYLRRRDGEEAVTYPSPELEAVLSKTLGVPLFQEQAMKVAMVGAGFSAGEADQLRRAMAAWKKNGAIEKFYPKFISGMLSRGYTEEFAEKCFDQIRGFGLYGFPESHAASFALLVYVSAWLKRYHPAAFAAALLNSQPMGFYAPAQIVRDARDHGVTVLPADVNHSEWDCTLEEKEEELATDAHRCTQIKAKNEERENNSSSSVCICAPSVADNSSARHSWGAGGPALRLGLRMIKGLAIAQGKRLVEERERGGRFRSIQSVQRRAGVSRVTLRKLAEADAFGSLGVSRRRAVWEVLGLSDEEMPLFEGSGVRGQGSEEETDVALPVMPVGQEVMADYATTTLSLKRHPVSLIREALEGRGITPASRLFAMERGRWVKVAGLVLIRQRPGTAAGVVFQTLEDETGTANLILYPSTYERYRPAARHAGLLQADGYVERQGQVIHVLVKRLHDLSHLLRGYQFSSRDFH